MLALFFKVLYLGGNLLRFLPNSICLLRSLQVLYLGDNRLEELPTNLSNLTQLSTLNLHKNQLPALPPDIVDMPSLRQLSLRGNPLVTNFALDATTHSPLSLQELCARTIKNLNIPYCNKCVPQVLCNYLDSAKCCSNPKCRGVYFTQGIKNIEFVDFCGKYRVPLLRYLCSPCFVEVRYFPDNNLNEESLCFIFCFRTSIHDTRRHTCSDSLYFNFNFIKFYF